MRPRDTKCIAHMSDFAVLNAKFPHKNGRHFEFSHCKYGIFNLKCRK